jgi:hypothetical protein
MNEYLIYTFSPKASLESFETFSFLSTFYFYSSFRFTRILIGGYSDLTIYLLPPTCIASPVSTLSTRVVDML